MIMLASISKAYHNTKRIPVTWGKTTSAEHVDLWYSPAFHDLIPTSPKKCQTCVWPYTRQVNFFRMKSFVWSLYLVASVVRSKKSAPCRRTLQNGWEICACR